MIDKKAVLVKVTVHNFNFSKKDEGGRKDLSEKYNADKQMFNVRKQLFVKECIRNLQKSTNSIRPYVNKMTLPWRDGGWRLLPVPIYKKFEDGLREINQEIISHKEEFISNFETHKELSRRRLGPKFVETDYPLPDIISDKIYVEATYEPVPTSNDFRIDIQADELGKLKKHVEEHSQKQLNDAVKEVWGRIHYSINRIYERFSAEDKTDDEGNVKKPRLFGSVLGEVRELIDLLPALNINNDPNLEKVRLELENRFAGIDIKDIKEDDELRKDTAEKAKELLNNIKDII